VNKRVDVSTKQGRPAAPTDVQEESPDLANRCVMIDVEEDELPFVLLEADEHRVQEIKPLGEVVNKHKVLGLFRDLHVEPENVRQAHT